MTEVNFARKDLTGLAPSSICSACVQQGLEHLPTGSLFVHCQHNEFGCMKTPHTGWILSLDISAKSFAQAVTLALLQGEALASDALVGDSPRH